MNSLNYFKFPIFLLLLFVSLSQINSANYDHEHFLHCLSLESPNSTSISKVVYTPNNSSYSSILQSTLQNLRFNTTSTPKPLVIVTPNKISHVQTAIFCSRKHNLPMRVRSGGHDYEGLSYVSMISPFVVLDLMNFQAIEVDIAKRTAWVQAAATLGQLYYKIATESNNTLAFPAGVCPTVGVGGHFSGGGYGILLRKYGLAADHIVDAHLIDANGRVLDRASMGEDLFWAIRGGGGNTFGIVIAWKINLVPVPQAVTVFTIRKTLEQNATRLVYQWQHLANKLHEDLFLRIIVTRVNSSQERGMLTIQAAFDGLFLGESERLLPLMQESFPELGLIKEDCIKMSWIESILYFGGLPSNTSLNVLLQKTSQFTASFKGKVDFVKQPIPEIGLEGFWQRFLGVQKTGAAVIALLTPYGGRMEEISESSIPFPHRAGVIFKMAYSISWTEEGIEASKRHISWIRKLYRYMGPYVSKNPREAYVNYRDLDIGMNEVGKSTSYKKARIWGTKYFKNNFDRLVRVKTVFDPSNFFRNEQSIPPLSSG